jgi:hypothetical protein
MAFFTIRVSPVHGIEDAVVYLGLRNTDEKGIYVTAEGKRLKAHKEADGSYSLEPDAQ